MKRNKKNDVLEITEKTIKEAANRLTDFILQDEVMQRMNQRAIEFTLNYVEKTICELFAPKTRKEAMDMVKRRPGPPQPQKE